MKARAAALLAVCMSSVGFAAPLTGLGTSAAADRHGRLWIVYAESAGGGAIAKVSRFDKATGDWRETRIVNAKPEAIAADGENRPKLAFGPAGEIYVTWTSPTSARFTGDIRFARSLDGGRSWSLPSTVHRDRQRITHRFESLIVDSEGRVWVAWIDKRDLHRAEESRTEYAGAAIYYAYSTDRGETWEGDFKLADHSCECCRIALALDPQGHPAAMWRHVFPPNERDHAFAVLRPALGAAVARATYDRWRIDACPHHGPGMTISSSNIRHAVWFNHVDGEGRAVYGQLTDSGPERVRRLPVGAMHAEVAAQGPRVAVAWKRFDGSHTRVESWISADDGETFSAGPSLESTSASDQPRLVAAENAISLVWRRAEGTAVIDVVPAKGPAERGSTLRARSNADVHRSGPLRPFGPDTMRAIEREYEGQAFWLVLWDLECTYCMKSLAHFAEAQKRRPELRVVTVTSDPMALEPQIIERLEELGLASEAYAFGHVPAEALRHAIDPAWAGEKPRAYRYLRSGERTALSGVLSLEQLISPESTD